MASKPESSCRKLKISLWGKVVAIEVLDRVKSKTWFKHVSSGKILKFTQYTKGWVPVKGADDIKVFVPYGPLDKKIAAVFRPMIELCRDEGV